MITMGGFALPSKTLREMIVSSIDVIVQSGLEASRWVPAGSLISPRFWGFEGDVITMQDLDGL